MGLKADLETLFEAVGQGWSGGAPLWDTRKIQRHGEVHGCLLLRMWAFAGFDEGYPRRRAMVEAMGFRDFEDMYEWNDADGRTWDDVKDRVGATIEELTWTHSSAS